MDRRDWMLLLVGDGLDPIRIQKGLFLFAQESGASKDQRYEFVPYNWGPFSRAIYADLASLQAEHLLERHPVVGAGYYGYAQTAEGREAALRLRAEVNPALLAEIDRIQTAVSDPDFETLLRRVYETYPEYAKNSIFRG